MGWLIAGLVLFLGIHSVRMAAPSLRDNLIETRGEGAWKGSYSFIALAGLVLLVWGYGQARVSDASIFFYGAPVWAVHLVALLMWIALMLLIASQLPPGRIKAAVKHPMILSVKVWAVAHLLVNGDLASYLLFGSFLVWAIINRIAVKRRGDPDFQTVAIRNDIIAIIGGSALFVLLFVWAHLYLFGASPWPV
ncbi:MAG: NnrU family protein [Pseudomonadota bacterium]